MKRDDVGNMFTFIDPVMVWPEASSPPPKNPTSGKPEDWATSDRIWIRVRAKYEMKDGKETERVVRPAYTELGRCVWPRVPIAHIPMIGASKENPATRVQWGEDEHFYEVRGARVIATHWYPCVEPIPPGITIPQTLGGSSNAYVGVE